MKVKLPIFWLQNGEEKTAKQERKIGNNTDDQMRKALDSFKSGKSIKHVCKEFNIPFTTLQRYRCKEVNNVFRLSFSV